MIFAFLEEDKLGRFDKPVLTNVDNIAVSKQVSFERNGYYRSYGNNIIMLSLCSACLE